jgi:ABC-type sugar transport system permease subunit
MALVRKRRIELLPYALIAPIALLLLAISVYPALYAIWLAPEDGDPAQAPALGMTSRRATMPCIAGVGGG